MKIIIMTILIVLLSVSISGAATIYVADYGDGTCRNDASPNDNVEQAIAAASINDTITVPAGNCNWTNSVSIPSDKKITLQGAGIGNTVISLGAITAVNISTSGSRVTGFEFNFSDSSGIGVSASGTGWRIDHCEVDFRTAGGKGTGIEATNRNLYYPTWELSGLVDNCVFYDARNLASGSAVSGVSDPTKSWAIWSAPTDIGGVSAVYFEDNTFFMEQFGNLMDGNYGGVYVYRFNTVSKGAYSGSVVEAHSLQCTCRGFKKWEIYGNTIYGEDCWTPFFLRGGTGVIFNNTVTGTWNNKHITMDNVRSHTDRGPGLCDGTCDWDGNEGSGDEAGYPCRDQIGRGADSSSWPVSAPYPSQPLEPIYAYGNTPSDVIVSVNSNSAHHIKANRDYYDYTASFNGTSGMGVGPIASRPATCTPDVGYWATDEGEWNSKNAGPDGCLYKCTSTDTWTLFYTPYTYPHPLTGGEEAQPEAVEEDLPEEIVETVEVTEEIPDEAADTTVDVFVDTEGDTGETPPSSSGCGCLMVGS